MAESNDVLDNREYVLANYIGEFSVQGAQDVIDRVVQLISGDCLRPVLIDCTKMSGNLSVLERFQTVVYGQKMIGKVSKLAIVRWRESSPPDRFVETAAANRGILVRLFTDVQEAVEWLTQ